MRIDPRLVLATVSLIACGTPTVVARQQAGTALSARAGAPRAIVTRGVASKVKADTMIQGNALNSANAPMHDATVRLRDARFGGVVDTQFTDKAGLFAFTSIDPGSYIVEIVTSDQSVLAASELLNVNAGQAVSAVVKLPFRIPPFAGIMGSSGTPSAAAVATQAAASSIVSVVPTAPISPTQ